MSTLTAPQLFAMAHGQVCDGAHRCQQCGAPCLAKWPRKIEPKVPFLNPGPLAVPDSRWICHGCWMFASGTRTIARPDGRLRDGQRPPRQAWVITKTSAIGVDLSDMEQRGWLRETCLHPPASPYVIALPTSKTELRLYLAKVRDQQDMPGAYIAEAGNVSYDPTELTERLSLADQIVAAHADEDLVNWNIPNSDILAERFHDADRLMAAWKDVMTKDAAESNLLYRLATMLVFDTPKCQELYPPRIEPKPVNPPPAPPPEENKGKGKKKR